MAHLHFACNLFENRIDAGQEVCMPFLQFPAGLRIAPMRLVCSILEKSLTKFMVFFGVNDNLGINFALLQTETAAARLIVIVGTPEVS